MPAEGVMKLTKSERVELQRQAGARNGRADSARHARLILLLADGLTWAEIRAKLDCSDSYIDRWSKRFAADRLAGLFARYAGRERYKVTDRIEARVLAWTTKHKPADGSTHWSSRKLAAELGDISHMTVSRIWAKHGIKPHRLEGYLASNDPDFEAKAAEVIGLREIDGRKIASGGVGPTTRLLQQEFSNVVHGRHPLSAEWLDPVPLDAWQMVEAPLFHAEGLASSPGA